MIQEVLTKPALVGNIHLHPGPQFTTPHRLWQGCPTIERTPGGRLLAGWYSGGMREPDMANYNLLVKSDDNGLTWTEPILVIESLFFPGLRCIDIQLWMDPDKKLWLFWTQVTGWGDPSNLCHETWAMTTIAPDADEIPWSEPFYVAKGFLRCKPTVLRDGRYLLCSYDRDSPTYNYSESSDKGTTWTRRQGGQKVPTDFDESMILEHRDGTLHLFARTRDSGFLGESFSRDGGKSWTNGSNSPIVAPGSRFYIARLKSGNILRVSNDSGTTRTDLKAFLSFDDGKSWPHSILLDNRNHVSYPDVTEDSSGNIYIVHDWSRLEEKAIFLSRLTEADIIAGGPVNADSFVGRLLNQPPRHPIFPR